MEAELKNVFVAHHFKEMKDDHEKDVLLKIVTRKSKEGNESDALTVYWGSRFMKIRSSKMGILYNGLVPTPEDLEVILRNIQ